MIAFALLILAVSCAAGPEDDLAKEMTHDLQMNLNKIAPVGKEDTAEELQDHTPLWMLWECRGDRDQARGLPCVDSFAKEFDTRAGGTVPSELEGSVSTTTSKDCRWLHSKVLA